MRVALHACCGPCLIEPFDDIAAANDVVVVYANPNIAPAEEYELRRDTLVAYADEHGVEVVEVPYEPALWERAIAASKGSRPERCRACFELRLGITARYASEHGFDAIATTLTVSPYQDAEAIRGAGERVAAEHGLAYIDRDFRPRYLEATRRSRELGMYRQNYCGCLLSKAEAEQERAERRASRKRERVAARAQQDAAGGEG